MDAKIDCCVTSDSFDILTIFFYSVIVLVAGGNKQKKRFISLTLSVVCQHTACLRWGEGRGHWPSRCSSIFCFLLKVITLCCSPAQAGVGLLCAAKMQYSGLMRLKHFYLLERKVLHLKTSSDTVQIPIKSSGIPWHSGVLCNPTCYAGTSEKSELSSAQCAVFSICQVPGLQTSGL